MRIFLDTNVLVTALATRGLCAGALRHVVAEHTLVGAEAVLRELRYVLGRKLKLPPRVVKSIEELVREHEVVHKPKSPAEIPVRDSADRWAVASALAARGDILVTADRELRRLWRRAPLRILDPRGFWNLVREEACYRACSLAQGAAISLPPTSRRPPVRWMDVKGPIVRTRPWGGAYLSGPGSSACPPVASVASGLAGSPPGRDL